MPTPARSVPVPPRSPLLRRVDAWSSALHCIPLYVVYQLGLLARIRCQGGMCAWQGNGADMVTRWLLGVSGGSMAAYAGSTLLVAASLALAAAIFRNQRAGNARGLGSVVTESAAWAVACGAVASRLVDALGLMGATRGGSMVDDIVASCGAGLHEELVFRAGLFAGSAWLLRWRGVRPLASLVLAGLVTSLLFSGMHYVGALGDAFTLRSFTYRAVLGVLFAGLYAWRGFSVAAWTHCLYDICVFTLLRFA